MRFEDQLKLLHWFNNFLHEMLIHFSIHHCFDNLQIVGDSKVVMDWYNWKTKLHLQVFKQWQERIYRYKSLLRKLMCHCSLSHPSACSFVYSTSHILHIPLNTTSPNIFPLYYMVAPSLEHSLWWLLIECIQYMIKSTKWLLRVALLVMISYTWHTDSGLKLHLQVATIIHFLSCIA